LLVSLEKFIEIASESSFLEAVSTFKCSKDNEIERFLYEKALAFERKAKSRTYLILDGKELYNKSNVRLLAYFSLALQTLIVPESLSNNQVKKIDGFSAKRGGERITEISAFLIGQLGKSDAYNEVVSGDEIIEAALSVLLRVRKLIGGRVVFIECLDKPELIEFYKRNGFSIIRQDPADQYIQMVRYLS
jgi:hypothetical protein